MTDTIFAPATATGRAAVAVVRLSGPRTRAAVPRLGARSASRGHAVSFHDVLGALASALNEHHFFLHFEESSDWPSA